MPIKILGLPSSVLSAATVPSIEAYGPSWVADYGATNARYGFVERLANMLGKATVNKVALTGGVVAAPAVNGGVGLLLQNGLATDLTAGPYITRGGLKLIHGAGFNDYTPYNGVANGALTVESALTLAYSRLLAARIVNALSAGPALNSGELTYTGAWTAAADTTISSGLGFAYTATNGDSVTLNTDAAYNGEAITCIIPVTGGYGTVTLAVDGVNVTSRSVLTDWTVMTGAGVASLTLGLRIPTGTITAGVHAVKATHTAINTHSIFGGFIIEGNAPPPLIVPSFPLLVGNATVLAAAPWSNTRNQNVLASFPATYVDLSPAMSPSYPSADAAYWNASLPGHPNNLGYGRIAALLQPVVRGLLTPAVAAAMN